MKKPSFFKILASSILVSLSTLSLVAAKTDFNEVGKQMIVMLRNNHYETFKFDKALGERFFDSYIDRLDANKQFFLASDIEGFRGKYGENLHVLLITGESMAAANEIHEVYHSRVSERISYVQELLKKEASFSFDSDREAVISREDAPWFPSDTDAKSYWKDQVEQALLSEVLKRETIAKLAEKQGKENPLDGKKSPGKVISLRYERVLQAVENSTPEDIADSFLSAVAASYDPHTDYFSKSEMDRFMSGMQNSFVGIGAMLSAEDDGATKITGIIKGGPANLGGDLEINDRIVGIDVNNSGLEEAVVDIVYERLDKVVDMIRGKEGTEVRFKIEPANGAPGAIKYVVIKRGKVELKDSLATAELIEMVDSEEKKRRLGYIKLPSFYADFKNWETRCSIDIQKLVDRLNSENAEGIILDLRGNGGGSLEEVRRMTGFFTGKGPVVQVKSHTGQIEVKKSANNAPIYDGAMVVLIDKTSASASEILAGALQDYNRAIIVGDTSTFGKGTVQQPMEIRKMMPFMIDASRAGVLKPTIQKFYRVSGSTTQLEGVKSDIVLPSVLDAFEIGEGHLDYAMPHDNIQRAPEFTELDRANLFLPLIKEKSLSRVEKSQDFKYVSESAARMLERREENSISLNQKERNKDLKESEERNNLRNDEMRKRFVDLAANDKKTFNFYRLTLEDLKSEELVELDRKKDKEDYMISAKDDLADLDETPEWPSDLDPIKRESIHILSDLIEATESARSTGALTGEKG